MIPSTNTWLLHANLTLETTSATLAKGLSEIAHASRECCADLHQVKEIDTVGLAILLECRRFAKQQQKKFTLKNPPPKLRSMLALYNLTNMFL